MVSILIARNSTGQLIHASQYQAPQAVFCPECAQRVQLVVRTHQRPFFRHCTKKNSNNETIHHQQGKIWLANFWRPAGKITVEYVLDEQQRIDVFVQKKPYSLAIEYQCAPQTAPQLQRRHQLYQKKNLRAVWIFGAKHFQQAEKIKHLQLLLSYTKRWGFYVLFKLPHENFLRLHYNYRIHPANQQIYYQQAKISTYPQLIAFKPTLVAPLRVQIDWQRWYYYRQQRPTQQFIAMQNWCYQNRIKLLEKVKKTPQFALSPIYKYSPCYLELIMQIPNLQVMADLPLIKSEVIQQCANQERWF